jgi:formylglycine-generating enzyme required for sulfatase activity
MDTQRALLEALHHDPADEVAWRALGDALEESAATERAELLRLTRGLHGEPTGPNRQRRQQRLQALLGAGVVPCVPEMVNSIGMRLALVPAGVFWMGAEAGDPDERPVHRVEITRPFYLGVFTVTQEEYRQVTRRSPSHFRPAGPGRDKVDGLDTRRFPVENVSWDDATAFCTRLSARPDERKAGRVYRLPTEAEWEYAATFRVRNTPEFSVNGFGFRVACDYQPAGEVLTPGAASRRGGPPSPPSRPAPGRRQGPGARGAR